MLLASGSTLAYELISHIQQSFYFTGSPFSPYHQNVLIVTAFKSHVEVMGEGEKKVSLSQK